MGTERGKQRSRFGFLPNAELRPSRMKSEEPYRRRTSATGNVCWILLGMDTLQGKGKRLCETTQHWVEREIQMDREASCVVMTGWQAWWAGSD